MALVSEAKKSVVEIDAVKDQLRNYGCLYGDAGGRATNLAMLWYRASDGPLVFI